MAECSEYVLLLSNEDNEVVREGAFKAGETKCVDAVPVLVKLLQTNNLGVQEAADSSLRKIGGKETVRGVLPLLRSDDAPVRNLSMDILREVGCQDMKSLIELIQDDDVDIRIFASDILGSSGSLLAVEPLCEALLKDPEVNVRYQAAVSLGELGMEEAAPCLNKAMNDEEWVQYSVIEALTKIGHSSSVDALVEALDHASDLVASMIIDSLGAMGNVKAVNMLLQRVESSHTALRNKIVKAVVQLLGGKSLALLDAQEQVRFRSYLLEALKDEDAEIQDAAISGLAYGGGEEASKGILEIAGRLDCDQDQERLAVITAALSQIGMTNALREGLFGDDKNVARIVVQAMEQIPVDDTSVTETLLEAFWDVDLEVQRQIVTVAAARVDASATDFFVEVLDKHEDGKVLKGVVSLLGEKLHLASASDKIFLLLSHQYDDVKEAALESLIAIGGEAIDKRFVAMSSSEEPVERLMAVYALGKIDALANKSVLQSALEDAVPDIRKVAVQALASIPDLEQWKELVLDKMTDENKDVRLTVVEAIGSCGTKEFLPNLIAALDDDDDWVKIRAIDALGELHDEQVVDRLVAMLGNPNRFVIMKVIEALGHIGGAEAFNALLKMTSSDEYELVHAAENAIANIKDS